MTARNGRSRPAAYFEALYEANPDPWNFTGSAYEDQKYQVTLAALVGRRFARAFEIGCSIGVLTRRLAPLCDDLLAVDVVESALAAAQARCADMKQVRFSQTCMPDQWPAGQTFDLILLSEMLYFLSDRDIARLAQHVAASLVPGGIVLLVNYTARIDEPSSGDKAAEVFIAATRAALVPTLQERHERFRVDRLQPRLG